MKGLIKQERDSLIINSGGSLSNKELLKNVIEHVDESINKIVIFSEFLRKEYKTKLLKGLKELTTNPIQDYLQGKKELEKTRIIKEAKKIMKPGMSSTDIYNKLLTPKITPRFINSQLKTRIPKGYKKVKEYKVKESSISIANKGNQFLYILKPFELKLYYESIKKVSGVIKELEEADFNISDLRKDVLKKINSKKIDNKLKNVIKRHSIGFGLLDIIFNDKRVQDVYFYSSGSNLHINHSIYGDCETNIKLSGKDVENIATKIRVASGRPFDDSFPVIDYELEGYDLRVCGVREPLTFNGIGYAFRKHRQKPWNLSDFIENGMITTEIAGLLNFLVDGQCSILITGPRGSGKTSLLSALINEVPLNQRIIVIEDTPELPVKKLSKAGFKIQHLRIKAPLKERTTGYELSAEEALRTALRLGESVLVMGEVRGEEAKALFEAMRVGATGNVVLGTIHGSTVYDTFDRVVNDLKVPATSFKSTDIIISCANLRRGESLLSDRRVVSITEVHKNWTNKPVFKEIARFDNQSKKLKITKLKESYVINKIAELKGMSVNQCLNSIKLRAKAKELLVKHLGLRNPSIIAGYNTKISELLSQKDKKFLSKLREFLYSATKE